MKLEDIGYKKFVEDSNQISFINDFGTMLKFYKNTHLVYIARNCLNYKEVKAIQGTLEDLGWQEKGDKIGGRIEVNY